MLPRKEALLHSSIVAIAGGAAVALLILMCVGEGAPGALTGLGRGSGARASPAAPAARQVDERREAVPDRAGRVRVLSVEGAPLEGVLLLDTREARLPPEAGVPPLAVSDRLGRIRIGAAELSKSIRFVLWSAGYSPLLLPELRAGRSIDVRMERAFSTSIRVRHRNGMPVAGYRVALSRADPAVSGVGVGSGSALRARPAGQGGAHLVGESDAGGLIQVEGLARGRYYLRCNLGGMAVSSVEAPIYLDLPGPAQSVVVDEYHAMVVRYRGDDVVASSHLGLGPHAVFKSPGSALEREVVAATAKALEQRFPGAEVAVGQPRESADVERRTKLAVFGRRSGRFVHDVAIRPISSIRAPDEVEMPTGTEDRTGSLRVVPKDASGRSLTGDGGRVAFVCSIDGFTTRIFASCNSTVLVPEGDWSLSPAGEFPREAFATKRVKVTAGMVDDVEVQLQQHLYRYSVRLTMADGKVPLQWGLQLGGDFNGFAACRGADFSFYSRNEEVSFISYIHGYKPMRGILRHGEGVQRPGGMREFALRMVDLDLNR